MMARWAERHPLLWVGLLELLMIAVFVVAGATARLLGLPTASLGLFADATLALVAVLLLTGMRWWREVGFRPLDQVGTLRLFWPVLVLVLVPFLVGGFHPPAGPALPVLLLLAVLSGFVEEVYFRGLMLRALRARGAWQAAWISAGLFGLTHALNVLAGSDPLYSLLQVGYALAIGLTFAALALRTGLLWPLVLTHILTNTAAFLASGGPGATEVTPVAYVVTALYITLFIGYGVYLLRRGLRFSHEPIRI